MAAPSSAGLTRSPPVSDGAHGGFRPFQALAKRWTQKKAQGEIDISSSLCMLTEASIRVLAGEGPHTTT